MAGETKYHVIFPGIWYGDMCSRVAFLQQICISSCFTSYAMTKLPAPTLPPNQRRVQLRPPVMWRQPEAHGFILFVPVVSPHRGSILCPCTSWMFAGDRTTEVIVQICTCVISYQSARERDEREAAWNKGRAKMGEIFWILVKWVKQDNVWGDKVKCSLSVRL